MPKAHAMNELVDGLPRPAFIDVLGSELAVAAATLAPTIGVTARRVGVLADTHCVSADGSDLPDAVLEALAGCDLILHCGDVSALGVLDRLSTLAPVLSVRTTIDPPADGVRLHEGPAAGPCRSHAHRHGHRPPRSHGSVAPLRHRRRHRVERHQPRPQRRSGGLDAARQPRQPHHPVVGLWSHGRDHRPRRARSAVHIVHLPRSQS